MKNKILIFSATYNEVENIENFLTFVTGVIIFLPVCFVDKPIHAIVMGVTMHYTQYLVLTYKICRNSLIDNPFGSTGSND